MNLIGCEYSNNEEPHSVTCEEDGMVYEFVRVVYCHQCKHFKEGKHCTNPLRTKGIRYIRTGIFDYCSDGET